MSSSLLFAEDAGKGGAPLREMRLMLCAEGKSWADSGLLWVKVAKPAKELLLQRDLHVVGRAAKVGQLMANGAEGPHWPKARRRRTLENFGL